jgi:DNA-binding response OmpR family regulator
MKKILLAEDDKKIALAITIRLHAANYEVITVPDGVLGYEWSVTARPDLIVTDIMMPHASGLEVASALRDAGLAKVPIIFITASQRPELRAAAEELGAAGYFEKPFKMAQLLRAIARALQTTTPPFTPRLALELNETKFQHTE